MDAPFINQLEAREYVSKIEDSKERLLSEALLSRAIGHLIRDPLSWEMLKQRGFDLLLLARVVHDFAKASETIAKILDGQYKTMDDLPF